ncbi:MAG TPA: MerR family transcriptional regulator [Bryobacteraceae bacterium]
MAEFAELAGVTVRALHHYDRLGLLRPKRTRTGYRKYTARDVERLEQVVALKFLGIPLKQIGAMLGRNGHDLPAALRRQRVALEEKRRLLDRAIEAIQRAETVIQAGQKPDTTLLTKIIEEIEMQDNVDWMKKYSSDETWDKLTRRQWTPELQERATRDWTELFRDVEAALEEDPAGPRAQALADRWMKLVEGFTGGDPDITRSVSNLYNDRPNWPAHFQEQIKPFSNKAVWAFMNRALACRK